MAPSRRAFLKSAVGGPALLSLAPTVPAFLTRAAGAAEAGKGKGTVLVVVQLSGGNDGLNTVVPYADDAYGQKRKTLRLTGKQVHKIDDYLGFHPKMQGFARLHKQGRLCVVQGVGYPNNNRGHNEAMREWHTGRPAQPQCPTGWIGRAIDGALAKNSAHVPGLFVGPIAQPFALNAAKGVVPSIRSAEELTLKSAAGLAGASPAGRGEGGGELADHVRRTARAAVAASKQVQAVLARSAGTHRYPDQGLAKHLKTVAELIRADVGIRIFFVELGGGGIGGFDNHAIQRDNHAAVLGQLSDSVAAFADDLAADKTLDRVCLMTFSEFGRTLTENGRRGTGHGAAAPVGCARVDQI